LYPINHIIELHFGQKPSEIVKLAGGDINEVYQAFLLEKSVVIKINNSQLLPQLFEKEKQGLELLSKSTFIVPKPLKVGSIDDTAFLIMDYIKQGNSLNWAVFGEKLAQLHQIEGKYFGLDHDNYIGSVEQINQECGVWSEFYTNHRLLALTAKARDQGLFEKKHCIWIEKLCQRLDELIPTCKPSLIHGDLWSGNLLIHSSGHPVLIDPAVYYGHPEMDWAMLSLFGSYPKEAMDYYQNHYPLERGLNERMDIHQLYPLLVHLMLFGEGYLSGIESTLKKYA
tara:strand:- start:1959 stop:2807 length:849 start_codon:yes stop_codon:yes gene_type:complete